MNTTLKRARKHPLRFRVATLAVVAALSSMAAIVPQVPASAAPGDPFDPTVPYVFVSQEALTILYTAVGGADGSITFNDPSAAFDGRYNAIGFDESSGYIYGIVQVGTTIPARSIIRIGQDGVITQVGTATTAAVWGAVVGGKYYAGSNTSPNFMVWDINTGVLENKTLDASPGVYDVTYADGFFWGSDGTSVVRLDLLAATPTTEVFAFAHDTLGLHGAAWTYGNGNVAFSNNDTGLITQLRITDPSSAAPTFSIIGQVQGPASATNDGASSAGLGTDMSITKTTTTPIVVAGDRAQYDLVVTNLGPSVSSGSIVSDVLPADLTAPATSTPGCSFAGSTLTCAIGVLPVGGSVNLSYSALAPAVGGGVIVNTATVTGNELDPNLANNTDSASVANCTVDPAQLACDPAPALTLLKSASTSLVAAVGEVVTYSFLVTNTGNVTLTDVGVTETDFSGSNALSAIDCPLTVLLPSRATTCTATYVTSQADADAGRVTNSATAHGTPPGGGGPVDSPVSSAEVGVRIALAATGVEGTTVLAVSALLLTFLGMILLASRQIARRRVS